MSITKVQFLIKHLIFVHSSSAQFFINHNKNVTTYSRTMVEFAIKVLANYHSLYLPIFDATENTYISIDAQ